MALTSNQKGAITVFSLLGLIAVGLLGYRFYSKNKLGKAEEKQTESELANSFNALPQRIGGGAIKSGDDAYQVFVGDGMYTFVFYSNGRVWIYKNKTKNSTKDSTVFLKGNYYLSGKRITIDGGDSYENESVWNNLSNIIK